MPLVNGLPTIAEDCQNYPHLPITSLEPLQGNLKDLNEREYLKLKRLIVDWGIIVPFFIWKEVNKVIDGHQRQRVFMNEEWFMDVPVHYISAASEQEAKQKLLAITSQFGKATQEGFDDFAADMNMEWIKDHIQIDALPFVFNVPIPRPMEVDDQGATVCPRCHQIIDNEAVAIR